MEIGSRVVDCHSHLGFVYAFLKIDEDFQCF